MSDIFKHVRIVSVETGKSQEYVTCSVCGERYVGKVPKGGDGTLLVPRQHKCKVGAQKRKVTRCPGSDYPAKEYQNV